MQGGEKQERSRRKRGTSKRKKGRKARKKGTRHKGNRPQERGQSSVCAKNAYKQTPCMTKQLLLQEATGGRTGQEVQKGDKAGREATKNKGRRLKGHNQGSTL